MLNPTASPRSPMVVLAVAGLLAVSACDREAAPAPAPPEPATPAPAVTVTAPSIVLDRAGFLAAVDAAASDYAAGGPGTSQTSLVGRRFTIRQVFGCGGPAATPPAADDASGNGQGVWSWSADHKSQLLNLTPGDWTNSALLAGETPTWEAAEGFWISRPWLRGDGCPGAQPDPLAGQAAASPQTVGLAAVFTAEGSRLGRRNGRAYSFTLRGEGGQPPATSSGGYRVVMEGRFTAFPDGRAIRCRAASVDQRPVCIAAVQLDRVAFETADGALLSEWRTG